MLPNRTVFFATAAIVSLQGCSLIIDTNPDGVIPNKKTAGAAGKSADASAAGAAQGGSGSDVVPGGGGKSGTEISAGGTNATSNSGGTTNGTSTSTNGGNTNGSLGGAPNTGGALDGTGGALGGGGATASGTERGGSTVGGTSAGGTAPSTGGAATSGGTTASTQGGASGSGTGTTCSSGTPCGTSCVDLATDKNHCGACGHSCRYASSSCIAGKCQPVVLAKVTSSNVGGITQDANYIYWAEHSIDVGRVMRTAKDGSMDPAVSQFLAITGPQPRGPVVINNTLQWSYSTNGSASSPGGFQYLTINPLGTTKNAGIDENGYIDYVVASGGRIYYIASVNGGWAIRSTTPGSSTPTTICGQGSTNCTVEETYGLAVDSTNVYWGDMNNTVWKAPLAGGTPVSIASWPSLPKFNVGCYDVLRNNLYCWVQSNLMRVDTTGLTSPTTVSLTPPIKGSFKVDESGFYWVGNDQGVWFLPAGTSSPTLLASTQTGGGPGALLTIDSEGTSVYWLTYDGTAIMAVVK